MLARSTQGSTHPEGMKTGKAEDDNVLTIEGLAVRLKKSESWVYRTPLPHLKTGVRGRRFYWPTVLTFLSADAEG